MIGTLKAAIKVILHSVLYNFRPRDGLKMPHRVYGGRSHHTFIGYYDIQPFDAAEKNILMGRCPSSHNGRAMDVPLELGIVKRESGEFQTFDKTPLWNWQQGCRLQWQKLNGVEYIAYNTVVDGSPACVLYDNKAKSRAKAFPFPVYCFSGDGKMAATLDFAYLQQCRPGYGYDYKDVAIHPDTYVRIYDVRTLDLKTELLISDVLALNPHPTMRKDGAIHYFNHLHFNPAGTRLMLFHIWENEGVRRVRALTMNSDGSNLCDVTGGVHVSHYWWLDDNSILFYGTDLTHGVGYHIYHADGGGYVGSLDNKALPDIDGHPSQHPEDPDVLMGDTVQDRLFRRKLWIYNRSKDRVTNLGYLHSPVFLKGEHRCDLHPRWSPSGKFIIADSAHNGYRQVVILELNK